MAQTATMYRVQIGLSDADRSVYETLDVRLAQHPSENSRFLVTRMLAYALAYEEGIAFAKGGISDTTEPTIGVRDPTGRLLAWIDVGAPSADRIHKAAKLAERVSIWCNSGTNLGALEREVNKIHRAASIEVHRFDAAFLEAIETRLERHTKLDLTRSGGHLFVTMNGETLDAPLASSMLAT